jgi:hypothetical protein
MCKMKGVVNREGKESQGSKGARALENTHTHSTVPHVMMGRYLLSNARLPTNTHARGGRAGRVDLCVCVRVCGGGGRAGRGVDKIQSSWDEMAMDAAVLVRSLRPSSTPWAESNHRHTDTVPTTVIPPPPPSDPHNSTHPLDADFTVVAVRGPHGPWHLAAGARDARVWVDGGA